MCSEIEMTRFNSNLLSKQVKNVSKAVNMYAVKSESQWQNATANTRSELVNNLQLLLDNVQKQCFDTLPSGITESTNDAMLKSRNILKSIK